MPDPINQEVRAIEELIEVLRQSEQALLANGEAAETVTDLIDRLQIVLEDSSKVLPSLTQIEKALDRIKSGIGGVVDIGPSLLNRGLSEAARGYKEFLDAGTFDTDLVKQMGDELAALSDVDLEDLAEELRKISGEEFSVDRIKAYVDILRDLENVRALGRKQLESIGDYQDALRQIQVGWKQVGDTLSQLSDADISKLAEEFKKISDTELPVDEIEKLLKVSGEAAASTEIKLSDLKTALDTLQSAGDIEVNIIEPTDIKITEESIRELEESIARLEDIDLSKVSDEFKRLTESDFPVENIKSFIENLQQVSEQEVIDPSQIISVEKLIESLNNLKAAGEIPRSIKEIGEEILKLSDADLSKISEEIKAVANTDFPIENIKAFAESLTEFKLDPDAEQTFIQLEKALTLVTDSSQLTTSQVRKLGDEIERLEKINIQRLAEEFKKLTGIDEFPIENIRAFAETLKDIESRDVIPPEAIETVKALDKALENIQSAQALPFEDLATDLQSAGVSAEYFTDKLDYLKSQLERASKDSNEFKLELQFLKENLGDLGLSEDAVNRIVEHFKDLGKIESPARLFEELSQLGLPTDEIERFAKSFAALRSNSRLITEFIEKLKSVDISKESIKDLVTEIINLGVALNTLNASSNVTKNGVESLGVSWQTYAGITKRTSHEIDTSTRSIKEFGDSTEEVIPEVDQFVATLQKLGVAQDSIERIKSETFDAGVTSFGTLRGTELADDITKYTTTLKLGERATQSFTIYVDNLGNAFKTVSEIVQKNPLDDFIADLESFQVPQVAIDEIVGETFGQGKELSSPRLQELNDGFLKLTGNIKAAGGTTKAYVAYIDELGNVLKALPVKEVSVSMQDFTDVLSNRVGAIDNVNKMLERYGFELSSLKKLETEAGSGITRLEFSMKSMGGATEKLTLHVTEFGKVLTDTQRRFRTFAGGIARNIGESFKWAVAITAVYGPLRKLQDLVQISIDNESKLADIGVVLGKNTAELQTVFSDAVKAAKATGESLNGVIEGYALAYRATGNLATETERAEVANQLLIDSLVLSKLSTLDQAEAMDTLVAGLLQAGYSLDQGSELLNKWVAVSKVANVSVDTLATSFAIMATAAEGVGLSFDELNAIIAVVAANTELSAKEAGNAVRSFVSGFQTDNARKELAKFGIAVEDLNGDARNFMSVMYDIKELFDAGLIDDAELNKIGTALGGRGARRGAQFTTFLKSLEEVQGLVTTSAEAQGDAYDALGVKMDTVQTSLTNLATSFQELANTMGTEGGVLDLLKFFVDLLDNVVQKIGDFVSVMGKAAPLLIAGGGLLAYGSSTGRLRNIPSQLGGLATGLLGGTSFGQQRQPAGPMPISDYQNYSIYGKTMAQSFGQWTQRNAGNIGLLMGQGMLAALNVAEKDWDGLGAQVGGGIAGFLIGGPLGSIIGSTIAEAVVNGLAEAGSSGELSDIFEGAFADAEKPNDQPPENLTLEERLLQERENLEKQFVAEFGGELINGINLWSVTTEDTIRELLGISKKWKDDLTGLQYLGEKARGVVSAYDTGGVEAARKYGTEYGIRGINSIASEEDIRAKVELLREMLALAEENENAIANIGKDIAPEGTQAYTELTANMSKYGDLLKNEIKKAQQEFNTELINSDITIKQYRDSMARMGQEGESIMQVFSSLDDVMGNSAENLLLVLDVLSRTSEEEINIITNLSSGVSDLKEQIKQLKAEGDLTGALVKQGELDQALLELDAVFKQIQEAQRQPLIQVATQAPQVVDFKPEEFNRVADEAGRILEERIQEYIRLGLLPKDTTIEEVKAAGEILAIAFAEPFGDATYRSVSDAIAALLPEAAENLRSLEKITPPTPEPTKFRIQTVDMTEAAFTAAYEKQLAFLQQAFGEFWQPSFETMGIIFSDGVDVLHLDNLAMQLAMNDLIDVNQKQLEGVYNLPTDASFYVPFQGYKLGFDEGGLGGAGSALSGAADELKDAAQELKSLDVGEDWGGTLEQFLFENYGAQQANRPTQFEATYPRYELPQQVGTEYFNQGMLDSWQRLPDEMLKVIEEDLPKTTLEISGPAAKGYGGGARLQEERDAIDKFDNAVAEFGDHVGDLGELGFGQELQQEKLTIEDQRRGRVIGGTLGTLSPETILPGATEAGTIVSELQNIARILSENMFNFSEGSILGSLLQKVGIPIGVGGGAGIGPQFSFDKLDSAADKLSNFADIMQPAYQYSPLGPQQQIGTSDIATEFSGMLDLLNQKISNLSGFTTNLKISSNYTANLIVDGRTLAQVIKPYLYSDMIRFEDTAVSITKSIVA